MEKAKWFVLGGLFFTVGVSILAALFSGIAAKVEAKEDSSLVDVVNFIEALWAKMPWVKKATTTAK